MLVCCLFHVVLLTFVVAVVVMSISCKTCVYCIRTKHQELHMHVALGVLHCGCYWLYRGSCILLSCAVDCVGYTAYMMILVVCSLRVWSMHCTCYSSRLFLIVSNQHTPLV